MFLPILFNIGFNVVVIIEIFTLKIFAFAFFLRGRLWRRFIRFYLFI